MEDSIAALAVQLHWVLMHQFNFLLPTELLQLSPFKAFSLRRDILLITLTLLSVDFNIPRGGFSDCRKETGEFSFPLFQITHLKEKYKSR